MKLTGSYLFYADQPTLWGVLMDLNILTKTLPHLHSLRVAENGTWQAEFQLGLGAISGTYVASIQLHDQQPPRQCHAEVMVKGQRSLITCTAQFDLIPLPLQTILQWEAEVYIAGNLASLGERIVTVSAQAMSKMFFDALARQLPQPVLQPIQEEVLL